MFKIITIFCFIFALQNIAISNIHYKFRSALVSCYNQHMEIRQRDANEDIFLKLRKLKNKAVAWPNIMPINPLSLGLEPDYYLDHLMQMYNMLMRFRLDEQLLQNDSDFIADLQCKFDIWMLEQDQQDTESYELQARKHFENNIMRFSQWFNTDEIKLDNEQKGGYIKQSRRTQCYYVYFAPKTYTDPINELDHIFFKLTQAAKNMESYYVLITSMIDWRLDSHEAKLFAKRRLMYMRDWLHNVGFSKNKLRGDIVDKTCNGYDQNVVKICIMDKLIGKLLGRKLVDVFNFAAKDKQKTKIRKMKDSKWQVQ